MNNPKFEEKFLTFKKICNRLKEQNKGESIFLGPIEDSEIAQWEEKNQFTLPDDYKKMIKISNGFSIFGTVGNMASLSQIAISTNYVLDELIVVGNMVGDGELICISKKTGNICSFYHAEIDYDKTLDWIIEFFFESARDVAISNNCNIDDIYTVRKKNKDRFEKHMIEFLLKERENNRPLTKSQEVLLREYDKEK